MKAQEFENILTDLEIFRISTQDTEWHASNNDEDFFFSYNIKAEKITEPSDFDLTEDQKLTLIHMIREKDMDEENERLAEYHPFDHEKEYGVDNAMFI